MRFQTMTWTLAALLLVGLTTASWGQAAEKTAERPAKKVKVKKFTFDPPSHDAVIEAFTKHVTELKGFRAATKAEALKTVGKAQEDEYLKGEAVSRGLAELYPQLDKALDAMFDEETAAAMERLKPLVDSEDPYLAAHATYYLGRAHFMDEHYEEAGPLFERVLDRYVDKTQFSGEALFYLGVSQSKKLARPQAIQTLNYFWENYPDAPERLLVNALHLMVEMQAIEDGRLTDVEDHMDYVSRRIGSLKKTGKRTQEAENRIIAMLDELIEEAEEQENQGGGGGGGGGGGQQGGQQGGAGQGPANAGSPANESTARGGDGNNDINLGENPERKDGWEPMRDRDRAEIENKLKARFPDRYQELIRQYYESLSKPKR